jgi:hypothetical protein
MQSTNLRSTLIAQGQGASCLSATTVIALRCDHGDIPRWSGLGLFPQLAELLRQALSLAEYHEQLDRPSPIVIAELRHLLQDAIAVLQTQPIAPELEA